MSEPGRNRSSPGRENDVVRSFDINRRLDVHAGHSRLSETIKVSDDAGASSLQRNLFVPRTPATPFREANRSVSERQGREEQEAYNRFLRETGRVVRSAPDVDPDELKKRTKEALKAKGRQIQESEALRQSQKELSMIIDNGEQDGQALIDGLLDSPDGLDDLMGVLLDDNERSGDDEYFGQYLNTLKAQTGNASNYYTARDEMPDLTFQRERTQAQSEIENPEELQEHLDFLETEYYSNVVQEMQQIKNKAEEKYQKECEQLRREIEDETELQEILTFLSHEHKIKMEQINNLHTVIKKKTPSPLPDFISRQPRKEGVSAAASKILPGNRRSIVSKQMLSPIAEYKAKTQFPKRPPPKRLPPAPGAFSNMPASSFMAAQTPSVKRMNPNAKTIVQAPKRSADQPPTVRLIRKPSMSSSKGMFPKFGPGKQQTTKAAPPTRTRITLKKGAPSLRLQNFLSDQRPQTALKPVVRTASEKYLGETNVLKLKTKAKQEYMKQCDLAKKVIIDQAELAEHLQYLNDEYDSKLQFINDLEKNKIELKSKFLKDIEEAKGNSHDENSFEETLIFLKEELIGNLQHMDKVAGGSQLLMRTISEKAIAAEVAAYSRVHKRKQIIGAAMKEIPATQPKTSASLKPTSKLLFLKSSKVSLTSRSSKGSAGPPLVRGVTPSARQPVKKMVLRKGTLDPRLQTFLERQKPPPPRPIIAKTASQKYISGTGKIPARSKVVDSKQAIAVQQVRPPLSKIAKTASQKYVAGTDKAILKSKATEDFIKQTQLAKQFLEGNEEYNEHISYLQEEYNSKIHFIDKMDVLKRDAHATFCTSSRLARQKIKDKDVLNDRLEFLKEELNNKLAYIDEAAGVPKADGSKMPEAKSRLEVGESMQRIARTRPITIPKKTPGVAANEAAIRRSVPSNTKSRQATVDNQTQRRMAARAAASQKSRTDSTIKETQQIKPALSAASVASKQVSVDTHIQRRAAARAAASHKSRTDLKTTARPPRQIKSARSMSSVVSKQVIVDTQTQRRAAARAAASQKSRTEIKSRPPVKSKPVRSSPAVEITKVTRKPPKLKKMILKKGNLNARLQKFLDEQKPQEKKVETPNLASRKYLPTAETNYLIGRAKQNYVREVEIAKKTLKNREALNEHLDYLKNELNAQIAFIQELPKLKKDAEQKYITECGTINEVYSDENQREEHIEFLGEEFKANIAYLDEVAMGPRKKIAPVDLQLDKRLMTKRKLAAIEEAKSKALSRRSFAVDKTGTSLKRLDKSRRAISKPQLEKKTSDKINSKSVRDARVKTPALKVKEWKVPNTTGRAIKAKRVLERNLEELRKRTATNKGLLRAVDKTQNIKAPISLTTLKPLSKHIGLSGLKEVKSAIETTAMKKSFRFKKKSKILPPTVAENLHKRDEQFLVSPLSKEQADGIFKMIVEEEQGIDLKCDPKEIVKLKVPSDALKLSAVGNAVELLSNGVITDNIPTRDINSLPPQTAECFASTVKQQPPHKFPIEFLASKRIPHDKIEITALAEPKSNSNFKKCGLLLNSFKIETFFQARGSIFPKWFPGMVTAFPEDSPKIIVQKSPSEVLNRAWQTMKPEFMMRT